MPRSRNRTAAIRKSVDAFHPQQKAFIRIFLYIRQKLASQLNYPAYLFVLRPVHSQIKVGFGSFLKATVFPLVICLPRCRRQRLTMACRGGWRHGITYLTKPRSDPERPAPC